MISYGQKLNKNEVRNGILRFLLSFVLLSIVTFLSLYLFFKSSENQNITIKNQLEEYKQMISKTEQLQSKIDNIYDDMLLLSNNKVGNDIYLSNKIMGEIRDCRNVMGKDSITDFKQHASFLKNVEKKMMPIKNDLIMLSIEESNAERKLSECTGKISRANEYYTPPILRKLNKR